MGNWQNPFSGGSTNPPADTGGTYKPPGGADGWQNPFKRAGASPGAAPGAGGPAFGAPPPLRGAGNVIDPTKLREEWDYKTAVTGKFGEVLPEGASGWTPYGTPYFGGGIVGKLKEYAYQFTKDTNAPTAAEWQALKDKWGVLLSPHGGRTAEEAAALTPQELGRQDLMTGLSLTGEAASKLWQTGTADKSIVSPVLRGLGVILRGTMDLFGAAAYYTERIAGAGAGVRRSMQAMGMEDLPDYNPQDNWFTKFVKDLNPMRTNGALINLAMSPRKDKWSNVWNSAKEGWDAGRIYYTGVYDRAKQEEYLRRYRSGENPELLAMELENPIAEMVGQMIFDPTNLVGVLSKAKTVDRAIDAARIAQTASGTMEDARAVALLEEASKLGKADELRASGVIDDLARIHAEKVDAVQNSKMLQEYGYTKMAAVSNQKTFTRDATNFIGQVQAIARAAGRTPDEMVDFIKAGVMSVSKDPNEIAKGVAGLSHFDAPKLMMNEQAIKSFTLIRRMLTNEEGIIDLDKILSLTKAADPEEFMKKAIPMIEAGSKQAFPTVNELADAKKAKITAEAAGKTVGKKTAEMADKFDALPAAVKAANFLDGKGKLVYNPLNRILGTFYFSLQGGVAVKNILNNSVQILIDQGPRAFIRPMEYEVTLADGSKTMAVNKLAFWSDKKVAADLEKMLGFKTPLASGFETQAEAAKARGIFSRMMEKGEESAASRVVWSSMRDSMRKLLSEQYLGDVGALREAGATDGQIKHLFRMLYNNMGDVAKTKADFRAAYGSGKAIDKWRTFDFLSSHYEDGFHDLDIMGELEDFAKNGGKTPEDVENFFAKLQNSVASRGQAAKQDGARITENTPGFAQLQKLEEEIKSGDLTNHAANEILRTWLVAADEAKGSYFEALQDGIDLANRKLPGNDAMAISEKMKMLRRAEREGLGQAGEEANVIIEKGKAWSQEVRNMRTDDSEAFRAKWREFGLYGTPPKGLDKQGLQNILWMNIRHEKATVWEKYYSAVFQESREIVDDLSKVMDVNDLRAKFTAADTAVERANALRSAVYRKGTFYAPRGKRDLFSLASQYDIPFQSASGRANEKLLLNIINEYNGTPGYTMPKVGEVMAEVPVEGAQFAGFEGGNPLSLLKNHGGLNAGEYAEMVGSLRKGRKMNTKAEKILPGLFRKQELGGASGKMQAGKGMAIDDAGELLASYGFISEEAAKDANQVRDFIRSWMSGERTTKKVKTYVKYFEEEDIKKIEAGFEDLPELDDEGNWLFPKRPNQKYTKLEDVPAGVAIESFINWKAGQGAELPEAQSVLNTMAYTPAYPGGSLPSVPRAWSENSRPALYALRQVKNQILADWGKKAVGGELTPELEKALGTYLGQATPKIAEGKSISLKAAEHWRDFILHNYGARTYGDLTWAYVMPYRFWYSRSYANWMKRLATDPHIIAGYAKYKKNLEKLNADQPEFYRGQFDVKKIIGIDDGHPLMFNLEAAINPLNGITGVDFNDREKRVNWWTASLDDMNKFGPTMFAPLQWAIGAALSMQGENDAAARWAGRAIPETAPLKSLLNWAQGKGMDLPQSNVIPGLKYGELDPIVNMFSGGVDPYERSRVGNSLAQRVQSGEITAEQAVDAANNQSGPLWDKGVQDASAARLGTNAVSWLAGVGFKPRNQADIQIESMFTELNTLYTLNKNDRLTPDQYRQSMDALREKYKFMDAVLLARRGGDARDTAYAYNVLGRLPPGASYETLSAVGLDEETINKFYDSKGFNPESGISFTPREKEKFMSAVADLGAMLELPDYATRTEWNQVKSDYRSMQETIKKQLGMDIWDKVSTYYDMRDVDKEAASAWAENHPEVFDALRMKQEAIVNDPSLFEYYGSIDKLEAYYDGKVRQQLIDKYGENITAIQTEYFDLKQKEDAGMVERGAAKRWLRQNPELLKYWDEKRKLTQAENRAFVDMASMIPDQPSVGLRPDFVPETGQQKQLMQSMQPENAPTWADVQRVTGRDMSPAMERMVTDYWQNDTPLPKSAVSQLDYLTSRYGQQLGVAPNDPTTFLRMLGIAMQKQGQEQFSQNGFSQEQAGGWSNPFNQSSAVGVPGAAVPGGWSNPFAGGG